MEYILIILDLVCSHHDMWIKIKITREEGVGLKFVEIIMQTYSMIPKSKN